MDHTPERMQPENLLKELRGRAATTRIRTERDTLNRAIRCIESLLRELGEKNELPRV